MNGLIISIKCKPLVCKSILWMVKKLFSLLDKSLDDTHVDDICYFILYKHANVCHKSCMRIQESAHILQFLILVINKANMCQG